MARRKCGDVRITLKYLGESPGPNDWYACRVSTPDGAVRSLRVGAPVVGFGVGIAYDSPQAYDAIAKAALSFASSPCGDESEAERETMADIASALEQSGEMNEHGEWIVKRT